MCRQPPTFNEMLHNGRPYRPAEVVSRRANCDRNTASTGEPVRDVGNQWGKSPGAADADNEVCNREGEEIGGHSGRNEAQTQGNRSHDQRADDAVAIDQATYCDGPETEADHRQRVGQ